MIRTTILLCCIFATPLFAEDAKSTNNMIKDCLMAYEYDYDAPVEERLNNFNWQDASDCVAGFKHEEHEKRLAEQREFLKQKPWFKGTNWKWEERAEYTCTKDYGTGLTYCHRPIYLN